MRYKEGEKERSIAAEKYNQWRAHKFKNTKKTKKTEQKKVESSEGKPKKNKSLGESQREPKRK